MECNLIGAIVKSCKMKSDYSHVDYEDDEDEDVEVEGMIVERVSEGDCVSYLIMDQNGRVYQTDYDDIDKIMSFGGQPSDYLKPTKKPFKL